MEENPYQVPAVEEVVAPVASDAEAVRQAHIKHEASVKSIGTLFFLGVIVMVVGFISLAARASSEDVSRGIGGLEAVIILIVLGLLVAQVFVGWGLRRLKPWSRIAATVFSVIGLIQFPVGTLIGIYCLVIFYSKKGAMVFSPAYQEIIAQTPHVKYRSSRLMKVMLVIAILLALLVFGSITFATLRNR
ncbi:hypothetical protein [Luteolibacter marinus]|uniref:hypothetical protein n=1 Tax=Luteolibacter marinus TaxID=2776705 RepID=UPI00186953EB|nr:hypothetical protein [Luteolibacter marinus]